MGVLTPTDEQQRAIDAFASGQNVAITAAAGTGKTSTLRLLADVDPNKRGLYLAFNTSVANDAKRRFRGTRVEARTVHSLAYRTHGGPNRHRLDQKFLFWPQKAALLGIPKRHPIGTTFLTAQTLVRLTDEAVQAFCRSADEVLDTSHVVLPPTLAGAAEHEKDVLRALVASFAQRWWDDWMSPDGAIAWKHDTYLKSYALSRPVFDCDYLLVDEAQDLEPLTVGMVSGQPMQVVAVGDENQAIYGWRGATMALNSFGGERVALTQSWRFGEAIADEANVWLELLGSDIRVRGVEGRPSSVWATDKRAPDAVLTRTNGGAMREILTAQQDGYTVAVAGERKVKELRDLAQAAQDLQTKGATNHRELDVFTSWDAVKEFVEEDLVGGDIAALVDVIETWSAPTVISALDSTLPVGEARITVSTAHVAKGLEWFHVRISDDFRQPGIDKDSGDRKPLEAEEARLNYVAVTRAQRHLDNSGLAWVHDGDTWVAGAERKALAAAV